MPGDKQLEHLAYRQELAHIYSSYPAYFKVCNHCRSVSFKEVGLCPFCAAYSFNESPDEVIETAKFIGTSAFPYNAGVVPRLKWLYRLTISVNDEPENLLILPPLDDSLMDKLILLKVLKQTPIMPTVAREERLRFWETLTKELPGFIWELIRWEIPAKIQGGRFGVLHFHHRDLLQAIEDSAPETKLLAIIDSYFKATENEKSREKEPSFKGTAEELESKLTVA